MVAAGFFSFFSEEHKRRIGMLGGTAVNRTKNACNIHLKSSPIEKWIQSICKHKLFETVEEENLFSIEIA